MTAPMFIDIEASSLDSDGYPVEIGWCCRDLSRGFAAVIQPVPEWRPRYAWNAMSERIHGLSFDTVNNLGSPADGVARQLAKALAGARLHSDNPGHDRRWLGRLMATADTPCPKIEGTAIEGLVATARRRLAVRTPIDEQVARSWAAEIGLVPHRALDDAIMHAIRLAVVVADGIRQNNGAAAERSFRQTTTTNASALLRDWARPNVGGVDAKISSH